MRWRCEIDEPYFVGIRRYFEKANFIRVKLYKKV